MSELRALVAARVTQAVPRGRAPGARRPAARRPAAHADRAARRADRAGPCGPTARRRRLDAAARRRRRATAPPFGDDARATTAIFIRFAARSSVGVPALALAGCARARRAVKSSRASASSASAIIRAPARRSPYPTSRSSAGSARASACRSSSPFALHRRRRQLARAGPYCGPRAAQPASTGLPLLVARRVRPSPRVRGPGSRPRSHLGSARIASRSWRSTSFRPAKHASSNAPSSTTARPWRAAAVLLAATRSSPSRLERSPRRVARAGAAPSSSSPWASPPRSSALPGERSPRASRRRSTQRDGRSGPRARARPRAERRDGGSRPELCARLRARSRSPSSAACDATSLVQAVAAASSALGSGASADASVFAGGDGTEVGGFLRASPRRRRRHGYAGARARRSASSSCSRTRRPLRRRGHAARRATCSRLLLAGLALQTRVGSFGSPCRRSIRGRAASRTPPSSSRDHLGSRSLPIGGGTGLLFRRCASVARARACRLGAGAAPEGGG